MASQAYFGWMADGGPWKYARPITDVGNRLREHGYTVYYQGNQDHLEHEPPEDHTPFSATGWPGKSPYPYCMAMDIMPPTPGQKSKINGKALPSLAKLAAQLRGDKVDGYAPARFVKYLNWEPQGNAGPCYHDSWTPSYARRTSTDRGHIHVSARSDSATSAGSSGYDLVARIMGEPDMSAQDVLDAFNLGADASVPGRPDAPTAFGRQMRDAVNAVVDFATVPLSSAVTALTALVASESPATADEIAAALAPAVAAAIVPQLIAAIEAGGATPLTEEQLAAIVEAGTRKVLGSLDN